MVRTSRVKRFGIRLMITAFLLLTLCGMKSYAQQTGLVRKGSSYYYLDQNGKKRTGFVKLKRGLCFFSRKDGKMVTGWRTIEGKKYHFKRPSGAADTGRVLIGSKYYYFNSKGQQKKGFVTTAGGTRYYSQTDGHMITGLRKIAGNYYYFRDNGVMLRKGWAEGHYFRKNGVMDPKKKVSLNSLKASLQGQIAHYGGTWSIYVKDMRTGASLVINNQGMYAASLIKLFVMAAAYQRISQGKLAEGAVSDLIRRMIADSDNSACNSIIHIIGNGAVNAWCNSHGFSQTRQVHGLNPSGNAGGLRISAGSNTTSVRDCGVLLERIYRGTCVNGASSSKMLAALKIITRDKQLYYRSKLPAGVPAGVTIANKTGDLTDYAHDSAIVFSRGADYVIAVMAHVPGRGYTSSAEFAAISRRVYNYFN